MVANVLYSFKKNKTFIDFLDCVSSHQNGNDTHMEGNSKMIIFARSYIY